jgi:hypothetical protein
MLPEALTALSAAGGAAVAQAAGTDAWTTFRARLARWFGRGDEEREQAELERLDQTATTLDGADEAQRVREETRWQTRIEALLESLPEDERTALATELKALLPQAAPGGVTSGRDTTIRAEGPGSVAAGVIHGGVTITNAPSRPRPPEG